MLKKTDHKDFDRDTNTNALINNNAEKLAMYKLKKKKSREINDRMTSLENDLSEMKSMMRDILSKLDKS